jgi:hypothetical protein
LAASVCVSNCYSGRETRIRKIQETKRAVEQRARDKAVAEGADPKQATPEG